MSRSIEPRAEHFTLKADLAAVLRKYENLDKLEILAVAAQMVGMMIAMQDQDKVTAESAMSTILANIEVGNASACEPLSRPAGRA